MKPANLCSSLGLIFAACVLGLAAASAAVAGNPDTDGWTPLFNGKDLTGWYIYLDSAGRNHDPEGVFKVENGMIHILDVPMSAGKSINGYLATTHDFSNVRIHAEYKWGVKRSSEGKRNSGLLYLAVGPDEIYPTSLECQIEETDVGDLWIVHGAAVTAFFISPSFPMYDDDMQTGTVVRSTPKGSSRVLKSGDFENREGWNSVDVIIEGNQSTHLINGRIVNRARDIQRPDPENPSRMIPLKSGRILLEAEGSEIWFRDIRIKPLGPPEKP
ncbi:MAG: 3-keto-disaccharide hydrolase [Terriglobales bacterium]